VFVSEESDGSAEEFELDSLLLSVLDFFGASAEFGATTTEEDGGIGPHALRPAGSVHGGVTAANHDGVLADVDWRVGAAFVGVHQVDASEEFVGGVDADEVFAGDVEHERKSGAGAEEDRFVAIFVEELFEGNAVADNDVGFERY